MRCLIFFYIDLYWFIFRFINFESKLTLFGWQCWWVFSNPHIAQNLCDEVGYGTNSEQSGWTFQVWSWRPIIKKERKVLLINSILLSKNQTFLSLKEFETFFTIKMFFLWNMLIQIEFFFETFVTIITLKWEKFFIIFFI